MKSEFLLTTQSNREAAKFKFVNMIVKTFEHYSEQSISDTLLSVHQIKNNSSIFSICLDDLSLIQLTINVTNSGTVTWVSSLCSEFFQNINSQLLEQNELAQCKAHWFILAFRISFCSCCYSRYHTLCATQVVCTAVFQWCKHTHCACCLECFPALNSCYLLSYWFFWYVLNLEKMKKSLHMNDQSDYSVRFLKLLISDSMTLMILDLVF